MNGFYAPFYINRLEQPFGIVQKTIETEGFGGLYLLAITLTDKFTEKYKNVVWGEELDWMDTLEEFLKKGLA